MVEVFEITEANNKHTLYLIYFCMDDYLNVLEVSA